MAWRDDCPLPRQCDCSRPEECLFAGPEPERPSMLLVWIFASVLVAVAIVVFLIILFA